MAHPSEVHGFFPVWNGKNMAEKMLRTVYIICKFASTAGLFATLFTPLLFRGSGQLGLNLTAAGDQ
jgi:hypothetical protein